MKFYLPFLIIITFVEVFDSYLYYIKKVETISIANCQNLFILLFNAFIFYHLIESKTIRKFIIFSITLFGSVWFYINVVLWQLNKFNPLFFDGAAIIQLIFALLFFYHYLSADTEKTNNNYLSGLWISTGILIFNAGVAICFSLFNFIYENNLTLFGKRLYNIIPQLLCIVLYSCISIALLLWKPTTIKLQQAL
jgi:hypothetical protein